MHASTHAYIYNNLRRLIIIWATCLSPFPVLVHFSPCKETSIFTPPMFPTGILQGYRKILHIFTGSSFSYISGGLALPFLLTIYHICDLGFPLLIDSSVVSLEIQRTCPLTDVGTSLKVSHLWVLALSCLKTGSVNTPWSTATLATKFNYSSEPL